MESAFLTKLKQRLQLPLPGFEAQFKMAHVNREKLRPEDPKEAGYRSSAVLILLIKRGNEYFVPLTERPVYNGAHSGQMSFPGGKFDEADVTLERTALRECYEEIGIKDNIEVIGELSPLHIYVSKFTVHPFVAVLNSEEINYQPHTTEVKNIIELPLEKLLLPELVKETYVEPAPGIKFKTPYFDVEGRVVWGATAMILSEFKDLLLESR